MSSSRAGANVWHEERDGTGSNINICHLRKVRPTAATTACWVSGARAAQEASMAPKECTTMATYTSEREAWERG